MNMGMSIPEQEISEFLDDLKRLRGVAGQPSLRKMSRAVHYSHTALGNALTSGRLPTLPMTLALVRACGGDEDYWINRWSAVNSASQETPHAIAGSNHVPGETPPILTARLLLTARRFLTARRLLTARQLWERAAAVGTTLILAVAGWAIAGLTLAAQPDSAHSSFLGPVDLEKYCQATGFVDVSLDGKTAYDWHCVRLPAERSSLSVIEACRQQYKSSTAIARYAEMGDPYSWQCWDHVNNLGRVDLQQYCAARGFSSALLEGATDDTWYCVGDHRHQIAIDPDSACRWQYGQQVLVAAEPHYRQPWEQWDCWK